MAEVVPISQTQVQRMCTKYKAYYNEFRCHQGIEGNIPTQSSKVKDQEVVGSKKVRHLDGRITTLEPVFKVAA